MNFGGASEVVVSDTAHAEKTVIAQGEVADPAVDRGPRGRDPGVADAAAADNAAAEVIGVR